MQINTSYSNNNSFKGTFIVNYKNAAEGSRECLEKIFPRKRMIYDNFNGKDTVLYVLKNSKDYDTAHFIKLNELDFQYMPDVDTTLQFGDKRPDMVVDYINKVKPLVITEFDKLIDFVSAHRKENRATKPESQDICKNLLKALKMDMKGPKNRNNKGITTLRSADNKGFVILSPKSQYGLTYAYVQPANSYEHEKRYIIHNDNCSDIIEIADNPKNMQEFRKNFNKAVEYHLSHKNTNK